MVPKIKIATIPTMSRRRWEVSLYVRRMMPQNDADKRKALVNLGLPTVDGFEFLRRQKQDQEVAQVPVVVMTALPEPSVIESAT